MTGQLVSHGDGGGFVPCAICGGDAAGPCARCRKPVCGDCCVLSVGSAGKWAICLDCDRKGGRGIAPGWLSVGVWLLAPLLAVALLLALSVWAFGK